MKKIIFLFMGLLLASCSYVTPCFKITEPKSILRATPDTKQKLSDALRAGTVKIGIELAQVMADYGEADDMLVSGCTVRLIYRLSSGKNITLWFDDGKHLSMWTG